MKFQALLSILFLLLLSCNPKDSSSEKTICTNVASIEGSYTCSGECVITDKNGNRTVITVTGETDNVEKFPGAKQPLYRIEISNGDFSELEIGALSGLVLRTATAEVSDTLYPVLEEYVFDTDSNCTAVGFTKLVRNPDPKNFKACVIYCDKQ